MWAPGQAPHQVTAHNTTPDLCFLMVESRPHGPHYLTEALQILPHILELDSFLLFQELRGGKAAVKQEVQRYSPPLTHNRADSLF